MLTPCLLNCSTLWEHPLVAKSNDPITNQIPGNKSCDGIDGIVQVEYKKWKLLILSLVLNILSAWR